MDNMDAMDAFEICGHSFLLTVDQDIAGLPLWGTSQPGPPPTKIEPSKNEGFFNDTHSTISQSEVRLVNEN